ncbi:hypothetical protein BJ875DRAFT_542359 [Amylocarpus encephaloides]|uniref:Uncharacterized protein n=1 Tax=Amylocarpus encephaloides TaxID=45428 RepID=A0A9P7YLF6_9HELO|nr:hypothetical protein BJ875DRAFT_542359 [Amylocarpus encephaloides]
MAKQVVLDLFLSPDCLCFLQAGALQMLRNGTGPKSQVSTAEHKKLMLIIPISIPSSSRGVWRLLSEGSLSTPPRPRDRLGKGPQLLKELSLFLIRAKSLALMCIWSRGHYLTAQSHQSFAPANPSFSLQVDIAACEPEFDFASKDSELAGQTKAQPQELHEAEGCPPPINRAANKPVSIADIPKQRGADIKCRTVCTRRPRENRGTRAVTPSV